MHATHLGRLDMGNDTLRELLFCTHQAMFHDFRTGTDYTLQSIEREDGSGRSFNVYCKTVKNPGPVFVFYVRN